MPEENLTQDGPTKYSSLMNWQTYSTKTKCGEPKTPKTQPKTLLFPSILNLSLRLRGQQAYTLLLERSDLRSRSYLTILKLIFRAVSLLNFLAGMIVRRYLEEAERRHF